MPKTVPSFPNIPVSGGAGTVPAWARPDILVSAPGGVSMATPVHDVMSAGTTVSLAAGQDINWASQRHTALAVKAGLSLFTYGKAQNSSKPNAETGMQLHAASGNVSVQAQANTLNLTADKAVAVASVTDAITMAAPKHVLLTAGGSSLRITNGKITLTTSGPASFKAGMKELTNGASATAATLDIPVAQNLSEAQQPRFSQAVQVDESLLDLWGDQASAFELQMYSASTGELVHRSAVSSSGVSDRVFRDGPEKLICVIERTDKKWDVLSTDMAPDQNMSADIDIAEFD